MKGFSRRLTRDNNGKPIDIEKWDEREMLESNDQAQIYHVLETFHPSPLTAEQIGRVLKE
jgi:hypothetical protein